MAMISPRYSDWAESIHKTREYKLSDVTNRISLAVNDRIEQLGLTRRELAERLGVTKSAVSQFLSGEANPKLSTLVKIADALDLSVNVELKSDKVDKRTRSLTDTASSESADITSSGDAAADLRSHITVISDDPYAPSWRLEVVSDDCDSTLRPPSTNVVADRYYELDELENACV